MKGNFEKQLAGKDEVISAERKEISRLEIELKNANLEIEKDKQKIKNFAETVAVLSQSCK
jgi:hypothetical protein